MQTLPVLPSCATPSCASLSNYSLSAIISEGCKSASAFLGQVPCVLRDGGAGLLNLSLLTSDLWAAAARYLFLGEPPFALETEADESCHLVRPASQRNVVATTAACTCCMAAPPSLDIIKKLVTNNLRWPR